MWSVVNKRAILHVMFKDKSTIPALVTELLVSQSAKKDDGKYKKLMKHIYSRLTVSQ